MKPIHFQLRKTVAPALLCLGLGLQLAPLHAQVILHPNQISGAVRFINTNPFVVSLLKSPGNEGMSNIFVVANSLPPAPYIAANSDTLPVTSRTGGVYQVTVDSANPGISYSVSPRVTMEGDQYTYWFNSRTSAPVTIGSTPPPLDFNECVGVVTIQFVGSGGAPLTVDGGQIFAVDSTTSEYSGQRGAIPAGVTQQRIYLQGSRTHNVSITVHRGTNFYENRIESFLSTNVVVTCDQFTNVRMVIPDSGSLARITGTVDMLREFELSVAANTAFDYPDYTTVLARSGPFANQRWAAVPGVNFSDPSSGAFTLTNVVPSTLDPLSLGYEVYTQMVLRTNRNIEIFLSPALYAGSNAPLEVLPGSSIDLGNLFVIDPGYLRGRVLLQGPAETLGRQSLLRGLLHAGDDDLDGDGIPDAIGTYGIYWSTIEATGVDRRALGAQYTAALGLGYGDFPGSFNPATSAYEGQYELAVGGLAGESSIWKQKYFNLSLSSSGSITNDDDYYYNVFYITDETPGDVQIDANQPATSDIGYCFSEIKVVFRTTSGTFYNPLVRAGSGSFTGTDFLGHAADYTVNVGLMAGTPATEAGATNIGQVVMYLPAGAYRLYPSVTPGGGTYSSAGLEPIDITIGCGQRVALEPCLQLTLNAGCSHTPLAHVTGSVRSCTNDVASIVYSLNGGPAQALCSNCGVNPSFAFDVTLPIECADNSLTVTATDTLGGISSITTALRYDATPPVIQCPGNLAASACDTNGAVVNFNVIATDNCTGPLTIVATPPSGSVFPPGTNTVTCVATDGCGNSSQCTFTVAVGGSELSIERAVIIRWSCGGILQSADSVNGPWTDIPGATSPYATPTGATQKFFRVKN